MSNCPVCSHADKKKIGEKMGFEIFKCHNCGSLYTGKLDETVENFDYSHYYDESNLTIPDFIHGILSEVVSAFEPYRQNGRLLDVGCGAGITLDMARDLNWQAEGVEVSRPSVDALEARGFKVFHGTLHEAAYPDDHFDVVTATEVIEHVDNPGEVLREIARILRPNGLLWLTTPHANGLSAKAMGAKWSVVCPPEHLHLFSVQGLRDLLNEAGFKNCRFETTGVNPTELVQFLRGRQNNNENTADAGNGQRFDRIQTGYRLNQWLVSGKHTKKIKDIMNSGLKITRLGDNLKVWATL